jgi:hypothetical protein
MTAHRGSQAGGNIEALAQQGHLVRQPGAGRIADADQSFDFR